MRDGIAVVLSLGALVTDGVQAERIVRNWLEEPFCGAERHKRRIAEIADLERRLVRQEG